MYQNNNNNSADSRKGGEPTFRASSLATAGSFSALRPKRPVTAPVMSDSFCLNLTTLPAGKREQFALAHDHNGSLLRRQLGADLACTCNAAVPTAQELCCDATAECLYHTRVY